MVCFFSVVLKISWYVKAIHLSWWFYLFPLLHPIDVERRRGMLNATGKQRSQANSCLLSDQQCWILWSLKLSSLQFFKCIDHHKSGKYDVELPKPQQLTSVSIHGLLWTKCSTFMSFQLQEFYFYFRKFNQPVLKGCPEDLTETCA